MQFESATTLQTGKHYPVTQNLRTRFSSNDWSTIPFPKTPKPLEEQTPDSFARWPARSLRRLFQKISVNIQLDFLRNIIQVRQFLMLFLPKFFLKASKIDMKKLVSNRVKMSNEWHLRGLVLTHFGSKFDCQKLKISKVLVKICKVIFRSFFF